MKLSVFFQTARCAVILVQDGSIFEAETPYRISVNGKPAFETRRTVISLYNLKPDTDYEIAVERDGQTERVSFRTDREFVTLNVREFGAKGDGIQDDTTFLQAAIMACPRESRVLIPKGVYRITSLFLKSHIRVELEAGAVLSAFTDRTRFPVFPGIIESWDEKGEYNLGTWEGNPLPMFSGIITGIEAEDVVIYGQGCIEGNASKEPDNWWYDAKVMRTAFRPRMIFLNQCKNITVQGITVQNSPSWNIHPYFSRNLKFIDLKVLNPKDSPNTDGLDPESCRDVEILGVYFSLGDDCIAVKSGKIYMGAKYKTPCENVAISQCCMRDGHGSITIGSEMAGGVKNLTVRDCLFLHTDRGLRIKTRRGRGKDAVIDNICFERIHMDHVMTPFVINSFYYCDPDGFTEYVRSKEVLPVDERTPEIKSLTFRDIEAVNCHVAAAYLYGLPEKKIGRVEMENIHVTYAENPKKDIPAMLEGIEPMARQGIIAKNITELVIRNVRIDGPDGVPVATENVDRMI